MTDNPRSTKSRWGIPLKVALAYVFFIALLAFAGRSLYGYIRFADDVAATERSVSQRRQAANELVRCLFELENAERGVYLGDTARWSGYEQALLRADTAAVALRRLAGDTAARARLDSLRLLMTARRENSRLLLEALGSRRGQEFYHRRAERLRSGSDSVVLSHDIREQVVERERTYIVERPRRKFFGRVADVFRRTRADTTVVSEQTRLAGGDSVRQRIDVGDSVARILTDIGRQADTSDARLQSRIRRRGEALQATGMELTRRVGRIMESIGREEQGRLRRTTAQAQAARHDWAVRIGLLTVLALLAAGGSFAWIVRDVSRAGRYRRQLEQARQRAEQLLAQRERLMLTVTHDIKAPAASVAGFAELLAARPHDDETRRYLQNIRSSADHLLRLVGELLDYHRLEAGHVDIRPTDFSPARLLGEVAESFRPQAQAKGIGLRFDAARCGTSYCRADAFRIRQVAENLLGNALKFTDEGHVSLTAALTDGTLTLTVADTGPGMTADEQARVFEAFARLPRSQGKEGVGLGLSITREIVTLLGGDISVESTCGAGSAFTVTLPVAPAAADGGEGTAISVSGAAEKLPHQPEQHLRQPLRILVIDDNATQLTLTRVLLEKASAGRWKVTACTDVAELYEQLRRHTFNLLLTDIEMPALSGFDLLRKVRACPGKNRGIPAVALTAHGTYGDGDFRAAGFTGWLSKPFGMEELARVVERATETADGNDGNKDVQDGDRAVPHRHGFSALTAFAAGDEQAEHAILECFRNDVLAHTAALRRAAGKQDAAEAGRLAHKLLPTLAMIRSEAVPALETLERERAAGAWSKEHDGLCRTVLHELESIGKELARLTAYGSDGPHTP